MYKSFGALLILMIIICHAAIAKKFNSQSKYKTRLFEVGLSLGGASFITSFNPDIKANDKFVNYWHNKINPGVGFSVTRNISPTFGICLNYLQTTSRHKWF